MLDYVARGNDRKVTEYKYQYNLALIDYQLDDARFALHRDQLAALRNELIASLLPWADVGPVDLAEYIHAMQGKYAEVFGDPDDPEYQKEIERGIAYLKRGNNACPPDQIH